MRGRGRSLRQVKANRLIKWACWTLYLSCAKIRLKRLQETIEHDKKILNVLRRKRIRLLQEPITMRGMGILLVILCFCFDLSEFHTKLCGQFLTSCPLSHCAKYRPLKFTRRTYFQLLYEIICSSLGVGSQFHNVFSNLIFKYGRKGVPDNLR